MWGLRLFKNTGMGLWYNSIHGFEVHRLIRNKRKRQATIDTSVFELLQIGLGREGRYHDGTVYSLNGSGETIRIDGKGKQ